jgi:glyoxylase-like metal-dependent hydrolase (beta-lactamase superfamily II)
MLKTALWTASLALSTLVNYAAAATDAEQVLGSAATALGADQLRSIEYSGSGYDFALGQAPNVRSPWPKFNDKAYTRTVNFDPWETRLQRIRTQFENPPRGGGGQPIVGEQSQTQVIIAGSAAATALPDELALTLPQAFVKVASAAPDVASKSETRNGKTYSVVTFTARNKARTRGWIDAQGLVERVETSIDNPVLGDIKYEVTFADYKEFQGVQFPTHIVQKQAGYPVLDLTVTDVKSNVAVSLQAATPQPTPPLASERLGDGVYLIAGGYAAVAVAFKDHILIIEGGQNDQRSEAVITEAKRLIPGKPIKELVNTHAHFDHLGGVRAYVAEGATIITHDSNKAYYQRIWANAHTLVPDRLSLNPRPASFKVISDRLTLTDGSRVVEIYHLKDFGHNDGAIVAYLPKEKVLVEADAFNPPPAPLTQTPTVINPSALSLDANVERLHLDVERIIPIHLPADNRPITLTEFHKAIGKA